MSWTWATPEGWLLRSAVGGGLLLLLVAALMRGARQPARRQRLGEWGIVAALLLAALALGQPWLQLACLPAREPALEVSAASNPGELSAASVSAGELAPTDSLPMENAGAGWIGNRAPIPEVKTSVTNEDGCHAFAAHQYPGLNQDRDEAAKACLPGIEPPELDPGAPESHAFAASQDPGKTSDRDGAAKACHPLFGSLPWEMLVAWLGLAYLVASSLLLARWLLGYLALWRLTRTAFPAPPVVARLFQKMVRGRRRQPRLLVSRRLRVPLSYGLVRPTVILPAALCQPCSAGKLRWVFAHELTHLERRDAWACLLFGLGQAVYFYLPWFWWLRRQVRLCQEYIADAAAVRREAHVEDYAQFLLSLTTAPAVPASATGVLGNSSDLFRRVTMLLQDPVRVDKHCPRYWSLAVAGGLVALAVLVSGISLSSAAPAGNDPNQTTFNSDDDPKPEPKKEAPKEKEKPKKKRALPAGALDLEDLKKALENLPDEATMEEVNKALREAMTQIQILQQLPGAGLPGKVIGNLVNQQSHGRLGVHIAKPSDALADQLDLPRGQGLVIDQVVPDSPAAKVGLKPNDILLEVNGKPVSSEQRDFIKALDKIKADTPVDVVILRKGKKELLKGLSLPEAKAQLPGVPGGGGFGNFGAGGIGGQGGFAPGAGLPGLPGQPGQPGRPGMMAPGMPGMMGVWGGGDGVMVTMFRSGDHFTTRHQEGSLIISLTGSMEGGKPKVNEITVQDGTVTKNYESADKVPERYQDKVKSLVEMGEKNSLKIETRKSLREQRRRDKQPPEDLPK